MLALNAVTGNFGPLADVGVGAAFQTIRIYLERVNDVLEAEPSRTGQEAPRPLKEASAREVSFRYGKDGPCGRQVSVR